ncbi:MAG TPA: SdrD B-like domain-containing protein [Woeseiaceae bacterium]|nr:SdrD B-like domain-containing protein [Woeseiaceae bacterium]
MAHTEARSKIRLYQRYLSRALAGAMLLFASIAANAQATDCSSFPNATLDGFVDPNPPSNINIDANCTVRNFPANNPLTTNFSFFTQPGQTNERWLIIFDNVVHTGQMSCNSVLEHKIWFTNGSSTTIQEGCQNLLIPVEKIDKQNPPGQTTAAIGVPFTWTLTSPVLFDPATTTVINTQGSVNDLHGITIIDDLDATGVDLTFLGYTAYWEDSGLPIPHTFSRVGNQLTWDNFPIVPAGEQFVIEVNVVLQDTPTNAPGTQFVNIAKWDFGRLIEGIFYEPLPGEWGISEPLTIAAPDLVVTKTGPASIGRTLNLGEWGDFGIDVHNTGLTDAWDVTLLDRLPNGPTGGMCDTTPEILGAQVFADAAGTPVPGKGPLNEGVDYTWAFTGAPGCEMTITLLTPAAAIGPDEHLVITYRTRLDSDSQDGALLTNVVGATEWFNGDASNADRIVFQRNLTDGTPGVLDHEDAHTTTVELRGYFFEKTVANLTTGVSPTTSAAPGDTLRYTLRLQTTDGELPDFGFYDDLGEMNAIPVFVPGSLSLVAATIPPGADASNTDPNGGTNSAGVIDIRNLALPVASELSIQFDVTLDANLPNGTFVTNQADLVSGGATITVSDDPYVNGQADPNIPGDEDPTRIIIEGPPPTALIKVETQATATIGETFTYRVTVPSAPHTSPIYDVRILDDLLASAADLEFVSVAKVSAGGNWAPSNTGTATNLVIEDPVRGIDIPAGEQAVIDITVRLQDTPTNVAGLTFTNTAGYTYHLTDDDPATERAGDAGTSGPMTVVEPELTLEKTGPINMRVTVPETFTLDVHNIGDSPAWNTTITDVLPNQADGGMCDAAPVAITAQLFEADGVTPAAPALVEGVDFDVAFTGDPLCTFTLQMLTPAAAIGPDQRLIVTYQAELDADTQRDAVLTNVAGATEWFSLDQDSADAAYARTYTRGLTDGTVGVLDHEDAHTVVEFTPLLVFEKTAVNITSGEDPATTATPGDTLRYRLYIENTSDTPIANFSVVDELDSLNATPMFQAGTLNVVSLPAGADATNSDPNGGAAGSGLLDVRNLSIGGAGESVVIEFEVTLVPVIANGSYVYNQSRAIYLGNPIALSDDPYVNGAADPNVAGDEDPTQILIQSAPAFDIDKISTYVDGDPNVLLAGETLRYTITVQNIGTDHATGVYITDNVPANTSYVAGSTTLNGVAVADAAGGVSPLIDGIPVNAPEDPSPGNMNAGVADNVATIVFDVVVYPDVPDGTIISNQAFVSAADQGIADLPSDDPRTPVVDDPTQDVVGNFPLLFAPKSAELLVDVNANGSIDPGDTLRYTITIYNNGTEPATLAELADEVPNDTTYVAGSTTLNGIAVADVGGDSPLIGGIPVSSADLTPPLPGAGEGIINPGEAAVVQFNVTVNAATPPGTLISNQATVSTAEVPVTLTDGDGNPATGPEPTVVVVGDVQQLSIIKEVAVVGGGAALPGATLEYTVTVRNIGTVPALYVQLYDDLDVPNPGYLAYVDQSATLNGLPNGVVVNGNVIQADYFAEYGALNPDETVVLRFRAVINPSLVEGTTISNTATVYWDDPQRQLDATVLIDVGAMPDAGMLSGYVWHDADHENTLGAAETPLEGWTVELLRDGQPIRSMLSDVDGYYLFTNVVPNYAMAFSYSLRFSAPGAGATTALLGETDSDFTDGLQRIDDIEVQEGSNLLGLNMPVDPNGVVYNAVSRTPVAGATVTLVDVRSGFAVPSSCFDDPNQQGQLTIGNGYYKFDINFSDPAACPSGLNYLVQVTAPDASYVPGVSEFIPPASDQTTLPFDVPACPSSANDAVLATPDHCEVVGSEFAPPPAVPGRTAGTVYHLFVTLDDTQVPGTSQLFNNHIPLDPRLDGAVAVTKTTSMLNVTRGQMVPYTITVTNSFGADLTDVTVVDRFPPGFRYVEGSARFDGVPTEPVVTGRVLTWSNLLLATDGRHEIKLLLAVGAGVTEGEFVNRAQAMSSLTGQALSAEAEATVRLVPDPTFDCTDVTGKVFDDVNRNGYQDSGEEGIAGVRLVTARGLAASTDKHGRYHVTCAITPNESRGSNFVMKLDDRSLPSGYRVSTRPVQVLRATRGKALKMNFGASIYRVVGLDIADAVFVPDSVEMRNQWRPRIELLLTELRKAPSVLRLAYVADVEAESLVNRRLEALKDEVMDAWKDRGADYELVVEPEIFWRLGEPPGKPKEAQR